MGILWNKIDGTRAEIQIPALGIVVARLMPPLALVRRREVASPELGRYDLHAVVSYFNQPLWEDPDYQKAIKFWIGGRPRKVFMFDGTTLVRPDPKTLRMEGVEPEWDEERQPTT
ncbi:MAG TPA: hypothetical protein VFX15_02920 [Actinomycetes bacterium]|nr:hypothetical protein [Actinomycetes bacterium]